MAHGRSDKVQPHDSFFKESMGNPRVAREFFELHLPAHIREKADLDTLKVEQGSFIDTTLGKSETDMLFSVQHGKDTGYLYLLVEHQSTVDYWMPLRLFRYMLQICIKYRDTSPEGSYLPLVYPIVFYTGQGKYSAPLSFWELFREPEIAKSFFMDPFRLIKLQEVDDRDLGSQLWCGIMEYMMRHIHSPDILPVLEAIRPYLSRIGKEDFSYLGKILSYALQESDSQNDEEVVRLFKGTVTKEQRGNVMTIAERLIERGRQEGAVMARKAARKMVREVARKNRQEGRQEGMEQVAINMLARGYSIADISASTGLSVDKVTKLSAIHRKKH